MEVRNSAIDLRNSSAAVSFVGKPFPALIAREGKDATQRFVEYFTANIRNPNTRAAYAQAVSQFCAWTEVRGLTLRRLNPVILSGYVEEIGRTLAPPSVKQHLAAIRMLFDWLVLGQVIPMNPAASVRGPKHVVKKGKTPVLDATDARKLLDSIETDGVIGLRDRALIGLMVYSFARVSAVVGMKVGDYYQNGKRSWFRFLEKGGKFHEVPAHHNAELYLDEYIEAAGFADDKKGALFRSAAGRTGRLTEHRMSRVDVLRMIKRRADGAELASSTSCHTFRATGITAYLANGGTIEKAQAIAGHESPRTTKLYDRTKDELTLDEIERILI
jgi:site-specific recombinase XerD